MKLGAMLIEAGLITGGQLNRALELQKQEGGLIGEILVEMGLVTEEEIIEFVDKQLKF